MLKIMMNSVGLTISDLLSKRQLELQCSKVLESHNSIIELKKTISDKPQSIGRSHVSKKVVNKIFELLDISFVDILKNAWGSENNFKALLDKSKTLASETFIVPLAKHQVTSKHNPRVQFLMSEKLISEIKLNIGLGMDIDKVTIKVSNGQIQEIVSGACRVNLKIEYLDFSLFEMKSKELSLNKI